MSTSRFHGLRALSISLMAVLSGISAVWGQTVPLGEALDATNLVWTTGGDTEWFGQTTNSHDGYHAAACKVTGPSQASWLETTAVGPATLNFWMKLDPIGMTLLDLRFSRFALRFTINPPSGNISLHGRPWSTSWISEAHDLAAGTNVLRWDVDISSEFTHSSVFAFLDGVSLTAPRPLEINYQPLDATVCAREFAGLAVGAIGTPPIYYQWFKNNEKIAGATNYWIYFQTATTNDSGFYSVLLTNSQGWVMSSNAQLTVLPPSAPLLFCEPYYVTVYAGKAWSFNACTEGSPPFTYQWRKDGTNLPSEISSSLSLTNVQLSDAGVYAVEVSNAEGSAIGTIATLTVLPTAAPVIISQPQSLSVAAGALPVLSVVAQGIPEPQFQWLRNGTNIPGAYSSDLTFSNISESASGIYSVKVSNIAGTVLSREAMLMVVEAPVARGSWFQNVENVSVREGFAYVAQGTGGIGILNVSDPDWPVMVGGYNTGGFASAIRLAGDLAFVADGLSGLQIFTVTNPATPQKIGQYNTAGNARDVWIEGDKAFVADSLAGLQIFDIEEPSNPAWLGGFVTNMSAENVHVVGNRAYIGCPAVVSTVGNLITSGLQIIDVSDPKEPILLGITPGDVDGLAVRNAVVVAAGLNSGLRLLDATEPATPLGLGSYLPPLFGPFPPPRPNLRTSDVQWVGTVAYAACGTDGVWVIDVSNPTRPVNVARILTPGAAWKLCVQGDIAYVTTWDCGLQIFEIPPGLGAQPPLTFSIYADDGLKLRIHGPVGLLVAIEFTSSLSTHAWQEVSTITLTDAPETLAVPSSPHSANFFRARLLQPYGPDQK